MTTLRSDGFTLVEVLLATLIIMVVVGDVFSLLDPVQGAFAAQPEFTDMQQRLRVCVDTLTKDLLIAETISPNPLDSSRIVLSYVPAGLSDQVTYTYWHKVDAVTQTYQLMRYDGGQSDLPIADNVVALMFEYLGTPQIRRVRVSVRVQAASPALRGPAGPLFLHGGTSRGGERYVPDQMLTFDVTPRNLH